MHSEFHSVRATAFVPVDEKQIEVRIEVTFEDESQRAAALADASQQVRELVAAIFPTVDELASTRDTVNAALASERDAMSAMTAKAADQCERVNAQSVAVAELFEALEARLAAIEGQRLTVPSTTPTQRRRRHLKGAT